MGAPDTLYEGGFFKAIMTFPTSYPIMPPTLKFSSEMYHPNVYPDGTVCISILHPPGDDKYGYEDASERWSPVHTVETILLSVISMLSSPNDESPANLDAAVISHIHTYIYIYIAMIINHSCFFFYPILYINRKNSV
ncbi:unnamed protein product [Cunninghamella blakesleeana]